MQFALFAAATLFALLGIARLLSVGRVLLPLALFACAGALAVMGLNQRFGGSPWPCEAMGYRLNYVGRPDMDEWACQRVIWQRSMPMHGR